MATRVMSANTARELLFRAWPSYLRQREKAEMLDKWGTGRQQDIDDPDLSGFPYMPEGRASSKEYKDLASRAPSGWGGFMVESIAQTCALEGVFMPGSNDLLKSWDLWQQNRWDSRQNAIYRGAFMHGASYATALPAKDPWTQERTVRWQAYSAKRFAAIWGDPEDEFPLFGFSADKVDTGPGGGLLWEVQLIDEETVHHLRVSGLGLDIKDFTYVAYEDPHGLGFPPIFQYGNPDLDGRTVGEVEPFIPLFRRIDQDVFDRLIVQRFGAWVIRYGTGLVKPETDDEARAQAILLRMGEMLISEDPQSKFGSLQATDLGGFIEAHDADLRILAAVSQRPPHHMLGASSNLQAEALAATEQGMARRSLVWRTAFGETHELLFRTSALMLGNTQEAQAFNMQARWRDMESRSLSQTADALGKLATQLEVPVEILWERIPGWTDNDTERAKPLRALEQVATLLDQLDKQTTSSSDNPPPTNA